MVAQSWNRDVTTRAPQIHISYVATRTVACLSLTHLSHMISPVETSVKDAASHALGGGRRLCHDHLAMGSQKVRSRPMYTEDTLQSCQSETGIRTTVRLVAC